MAKESKTEKILTNIAIMQTDIAYIKQRLDRINGSLGDYLVYKNKVDETKKTVSEITKTINNIKIKIWGTAGLIGAVMGFVGILAGKFM